MILIIGSFPNNNNVFGGSTTALKHLTKQLIVKKVDHILLDSTATAIPASPVLIRLKKGITRFIQFIRNLFNSKIKTVLIFHGHGLGFIEKGIYALIAKFANKTVILAPRSGLILENIKNPLFNKFLNLVLGKVDHVICQSSYWQNCFEKINTKAQYTIIQNWVEMPKSHNLQHSTIEQKYNRLNLLYTGWLESWKGIEDLVNAIILIEKQDKNCVARLDVFGNGSLYSRLDTLIKINNLEHKVFLHGSTDQITLMNYHLKADIFVLPSITEGMPNALLEAMSYGETCLSTTVTSIPEIIQSGTNGLLVEPRSALALKEAILQLANDPNSRRQMGKEAKSHIQIHHQLNNQVDKLLAICNQKVA